MTDLKKQSKPPLDPRHRLIIEYAGGYLKTFKRKVRMRKQNGLGAHEQYRVKNEVQMNYGTVDGMRCISIEKARQRVGNICSMHSHGKTTPAILKATWWDENRMPHDVTPIRNAEPSPRTNILTPAQKNEMGYGHVLTAVGERKYKAKG